MRNKDTFKFFSKTSADREDNVFIFGTSALSTNATSGMSHTQVMSTGLKYTVKSSYSVQYLRRYPNAGKNSSNACMLSNQVTYEMSEYKQSISNRAHSSFVRSLPLHTRSRITAFCFPSTAYCIIWYGLCIW